jgi:hypothetical protein
MLAEVIAQEQPAQAATIALQLEQAANQTHANRSLLAQLYWGEATELRLWLLHTAIK